MKRMRLIPVSMKVAVGLLSLSLSNVIIASQDGEDQDAEARPETSQKEEPKKTSLS